MKTPIERETALIFAAALLMQDVVHNKALDRPANLDKPKELSEFGLTRPFQSWGCVNGKAD